MPNEDLRHNTCLVQAVRKYPCLYNINLKEYSSKSRTNDAWESVAEEMNDSVASCKEKWRNLRIVYSRHLQRASRKGYVGKTKYYLDNELEFLKPFIRFKISNQLFAAYLEGNEENTNSLINDNSIKIKQEVIEAASETLEKRTRGHFVEPELNKTITSNDLDSYDRHSDESSVFTDHPNKKTRYSYDVNDDVNFSMTDQRSNSRLQFLQSLLPDTEEMTSKQFRTFRRKVSNLIEEILDSKLPATDSLNDDFM